MSGEARSWRSSHAILVGGVMVLVIGLLSIYFHTTSAYADLAQGFFASDPSTGFLLDEVPSDSRQSFMFSILHPQDQGKGWGPRSRSWASRSRHGVRDG